MAIRPPKLLPIQVIDITPGDTWGEDDGTSDPYLAQPYRWTVTFAVTAQPHSYHLSATANSYTGSDVQIGDWITHSPYGFANRIVSISSQTTTLITCLVEDVDRFNTFMDPSGSGIGIGQMGNGFVFELGEDGLPVLAPIKPGQLPIEFQVDLISRFRYRNLYQNNYRVEQPNHNLARGDMVYLISNGNYAAARADILLTARIVGVVQDVHTYSGDHSKDWFSYRPIGRVVRNIDPPLPGQPGSIIYLSDSLAGKYTDTSPTIAKPVFIQLENSTTGILLERGFEGATGESANVHMVDNIAERDLLDVAYGDQVYVADVGNGEWAIYLRNDAESVGEQWVMLVNEDAADTDAETFSVIILSTDSDSPREITTVSAGSRVSLVSVDVTEAFDDITAFLSVGDVGNNERLMSDDQLDLSEIGVYQTTPPHQYDAETTISVFFNSGSSTSGRAVVVISYT